PVLVRAYSKEQKWRGPQALTIYAKRRAAPSDPSRADGGTAESAGGANRPRNTTLATRTFRERLEQARAQSKSSGAAGSRNCRECARHQAARSASDSALSREIQATRHVLPDE